jgi:hydroxymethylbilane synthase
MRPLVLATRGSRLAMQQCQIVLQALARVEPGIDVQTRVVRTEGDRRDDVSLEVVGGQGVFVKDIEQRLLEREADLAVHSLKDMPAQTPAGLVIGAVLPRGDARDALVSRDDLPLAMLSEGARIGSDSRRRAVQLTSLRPGVRVEPARGNVDTRIQKVATGEYDAVVLAAAGLERLGLLGQASQLFEVDEVVPAVGQAVLAVECREDDTEVLALLGRLDDAAARAAVTAERAFLRRLGAGCRLPVGAYATLVRRALTPTLTQGARGQESVERLHLLGFIAADDGRIARDSLTVPVVEAEAAGIALAEMLAERLDMRLEEQ